MFSQLVSQHLDYYVYRLIDPRNGDTFYVGKGRGNRVFSHANDELPGSEDDISEKLRRVRDIRLAGFEVGHVIHRHGLDSKTAFEVEAALMDAYPGTTNISAGHDSSERGAMHADEIIEKYAAEPAIFQHRIIAITVNRTAADRKLYEAVRYAWVISRDRAEKADIVLAVINGLIVGAFVPDVWLDATPDNFPGTDRVWEGRSGFVGKEAPDDIKALYLRKRIPDKYRKRGAANPIRYINMP